MDQHELSQAGTTLFGAQWQSPLARMLGVDPRTVRRWVAGAIDVPRGAAETVRHAVDAKRAAASVAAAGGDVDDRAVAALHPYWEQGVRALLALGHHPAEIVAAGLSIVVSALQDGVGDEEAARQLRQIADTIDAPAGTAV